jgi:hypothetical protein
MIKTFQHDWNSIAKYWELFEHKGLNESIMDCRFCEIPPPVAVIGIGRGTILKPIIKKLGAENVYGFDTSIEMIKISESLGYKNIKLVTNSFDPLFGMSSFNAIIISTGVLEGLSYNNAVVFLKNISAHLSRNGKIICAIFAEETTRIAIALSMGLVDNNGIKLHELFDLALRYNTDADKISFSKNIRLKIGQEAALASVLTIIKKIAHFEGISNEDAVTLLKKNMAEIDVFYNKEFIYKLHEKAGLTIINSEILLKEGLHVIISTV